MRPTRCVDHAHRAGQRRWRQPTAALGQSGQTGAVSAFVPVRLEPDPQPVSASACGIRIEVRGSTGSVTVCWPTSAAAECGAWLREVLR